MAPLIESAVGGSRLVASAAPTLPAQLGEIPVCLTDLAQAQQLDDDRELRRCERVVIERYRPLADRIAARYRGRGVDDDDLRQLARLGLCKAIRRWRPELDPTLVQFATPTIEGEIKRYFRDHCRPIRMPRSLQEDTARHQSVQSELTQALGRTPDESEVAAAAGTSVMRVRRQRLAARLCQPVSAESLSGARVGRVPCEASERDMQQLIDALALVDVVRELPERDRRVLGLRFVEELSQREIGECLGVSQMQVSRILRSILDRLRLQLS